MRTFRSIATVATAVCSGLSLFFHFLGLGAFFGAILSIYLWRNEVWLWLHESWRRLWNEFSGP